MGTVLIPPSRCLEEWLGDIQSTYCTCFRSELAALANFSVRSASQTSQRQACAEARVSSLIAELTEVITNRHGRQTIISREYLHQPNIGSKNWMASCRRSMMISVFPCFTGSKYMEVSITGGCIIHVNQKKHKINQPASGEHHIYRTPMKPSCLPNKASNPSGFAHSRDLRGTPWHSVVLGHRTPCRSCAATLPAAPRWAPPGGPRCPEMGTVSVQCIWSTYLYIYTHIYISFACMHACMYACMYVYTNTNIEREIEMLFISYRNLYR